jgi:hypothetical protein
MGEFEDIFTAINKPMNDTMKATAKPAVPAAPVVTQPKEEPKK